MNILVLENNKCLVSYVEKFKSVPNSSRLYVSTKNYKDAVTKIFSKPILTQNWMVTISSQLPITLMLNILENENNINIIETSTKQKFNDIKGKLLRENVEFKTYDNTKVDKNDCIKYVQSELRIDRDLRKYICDRHYYYFPKIIESVYILSGVDKITKPIIRKYTYERNVYIQDITDTLLGINPKQVESVDLIYEYRYGFKFLLHIIKNDLELYQYIFTEISAGYLSLMNYRNYETDNEYFLSSSLYRREQIINSYKSLSFDKLLFIKTQLELIEPKSSNIYKLIRMIYQI